MAVHIDDTGHKADARCAYARCHRLPARVPLPRASAEGLPGAGIYALHTTLENKAFGIPVGLTHTIPKPKL